MSNYIDLVLCKHAETAQKCFLFEAPFCSFLKAGDMVIVGTRCGEQPAFVVDVHQCEKNSYELQFIVAASGATLPLKRVLKKVEYKDFTYEQEEKEDE